MIINNWYVAAESTEVGDEPVPVRMLGCDFVLFRTESGEAACLSAVCCHRGGDLSRGKRVGSCVQCPYHGWEYGHDGRVTRMPALGDDAHAPRRARVDSYPVQERYGYVWVFAGDLPEGERPELPDLLPIYGHDDAWRMVRVKRVWNVNWARMAENLADSSHLFLVHSFGKHLPAKTPVWPVEKTDWGVRVTQVYTARPTKTSATAMNTVQPRPQRSESTIALTLSVIGLLQRNMQSMASGYDQVIWNALTPIDANRIRHYCLQFRNWQMSPEHDAAMIKSVHAGFDEDQAVIEHLRPRLTPAAPTGELWVETDAFEKAYREQATNLGRRLGIIDVRRHEDLSRDRVLVIPSPARREDPGAWVHDTVPLVEGTGNTQPVKNLSAVRDAV